MNLKTQTAVNAFRADNSNTTQLRRRSRIMPAGSSVLLK